MICFADEHIKPSVRSMWKTVFGDKDEYIDIIFSKQYKNENVLVFFDNGIAVASLQMWTYSIRFYGEVIPFYYLAGLCTLPEYRNKGYMAQLILKAFSVMQERNIPLSILVPAEEWLFGYYEKFGYVQTFDKGAEPIDMATMLKDYAVGIDCAFNAFERKFQQADFVVLKTKEDLTTVLDEYVLDNRPSRYNLAAMSRIISPLKLLSLYAKQNKHSSFTIKIVDKDIPNDKVYVIHSGKVYMAETDISDFTVDVKVLTALLFGYKPDAVSSPLRTYFKDRHPVINLMLE